MQCSVGLEMGELEDSERGSNVCLLLLLDQVPASVGGGVGGNAEE